MPGMDEVRCIRCKRPISTAEMRHAVYAAEQKEVSGFSESGLKEYADGSRGWLHPRCFTGPPRWRQLEPPDDPAA